MLALIPALFLGVVSWLELAFTLNIMDLRRLKSVASLSALAAYTSYGLLAWLSTLSSVLQAPIYVHVLAGFGRSFALWAANVILINNRIVIFRRQYSGLIFRCIFTFLWDFSTRLAVMEHHE